MKRQLLISSLLWVAGWLCAAPAQADGVYTIYPVPQEQTALSGQTSFTPTVTVVSDPTIDQYTKDWAAEVLGAHGLVATFADAPTAGQSCIYLGVAGSGGAADQKATELGLDRTTLALAGKFDRHIVHLADDGGTALLVVLGENTDATFYGLSSLDQMLDTSTDALPCVTIRDYADQQSRGLVEGYYGYPYSVSVKKDIMRFMARYKLNTYLYGAKSDPYHSGYYLDPYPTSITAEQEQNGWLTQEMFRELTATAHATKVNFIWAIHPGLNTTTEQHVTNVMGKFRLMYNLGVRQFAVFTDDAGGYDNAANFPLYAQFFTSLQQQIDAEWNVQGAAPGDTVKPLHYVPHVYNLTWTSQSNRQAYFAALSQIPEKIVVYTTGYGVWTVPNNSDLTTMKNELGRNVAWWWNYPCNDNGRSDSQIFAADMYANFEDMTQVNTSSRMPTALNNCAGVLSNPMQQGEISKIALFSVADYAWNNSGFDNDASWEAAIPAVVSAPYAEAFRTLAPYLRDNDPADLTSTINAFKTSVTKGTADATALKAEMDKILAACDIVAGMETSETEADRLFFTDLRPWFNLVRDMASTVNAFLAVKDLDGLEAQWAAYLAAQARADAFATSTDYTVTTLESMGENPAKGSYQVNASAVTFKPFVTEWIGSNAFDDMFPERDMPTAPRLFSTLSEEPTSLRAYKTTTSIFLNGTSVPVIAPGEMVGIQLVAPTHIRTLTVADSIYDNYDVVGSANGKLWQTIEQGTLPTTTCRYVALRNKTEQTRTLRFSRNVLALSILQPATITSASTPSGDAWSGHTADLFYDGDYSTFCTLNRNQQNGDAYTLTLGRTMPVYDVRVCMGTTNGDYMNTAQVQVSADGKTWTPLRILGTSNTNFTMSNSKVVTYSDEMAYCDFQASGDSVRYVRLYVTSANTSKWLRLYEIEVNGLYDQFGDTPTARTSMGEPVTQVFDSRPATSYSQAQTGTLVYNLLNPYELEGLTFYLGGTSGYNVTVTATADGSTWTDIGTLSGYVTHLSLADAGLADAIAVRIRWSGASPVIHEIYEVRPSESTAIGDVLLDGAAGAEGISLLSSDGQPAVHAAAGISRLTVYALDGRTLCTLQPSGATTVDVPAVTRGLVLVSATATDGRRATFKVQLR